ncbi:hypothetical protein NPX13_g9066 [Xylaria arbuscula]|uniref:Uncharacterized protein n=1 Tax=Xylaria arbuscula TaxID=114810 RepID=A0A9W8THU8_9PEZI|nr:hypothetical protein NPX13_g9066 [Xylaria arbuscula]
MRAAYVKALKVMGDTGPSSLLVGVTSQESNLIESKYGTLAYELNGLWMNKLTATPTLFGYHGPKQDTARDAKISECETQSPDKPGVTAEGEYVMASSEISTSADILPRIVTPLRNASGCYRSHSAEEPQQPSWSWSEAERSRHGYYIYLYNNGGRMNRTYDGPPAMLGATRGQRLGVPTPCSIVNELAAVQGSEVSTKLLKRQILGTTNIAAA